MVKFRARVLIEAATEAAAATDLRAMSVAHTNKTVVVEWLERKEGG